MSTQLFLAALLIGSIIAMPFRAHAEPVNTPIFGSRLMSPEEREDYRLKMRSAKTPQERAQIRKDHHTAMKERAKAQGVTLPDEPPARGGGYGFGPGGSQGNGNGPRPYPGK